MSVAMDARKRKRVSFKYYPFPTTQYSSMKFLTLTFCIFLCLILFFRGIWSGPFKPAPIVPKLAVFSSFSNSMQDLTTNHRSVVGGGAGGGVSGGGERKVVELRVEGRVVFTDHVLVVLQTNEMGPRLQQGIDCIYHKQLSGGFKKSANNNHYPKPSEEVPTVLEVENTVSYPMLSADEYVEERWIVRCPSPPVNYTAAVGLRGRGSDFAGGGEWVAGLSEVNQTVNVWDWLVYDVTMDGDNTVAVFVKGLHLRSDRESDASHFSCLFGFEGGIIGSFRTKAITAAQEVIRCPLPQQLRTNLGNHQNVLVTVRRDTRREIVPTIAKLNPKSLMMMQSKNDEKGSSYKYDLCGCSMVWNQAGFMKEWIVYHGWLGVQKWFIYDNNSDDGLKEVINELESQNYNISRHVWPWIKSQEAGFSHCLLRARDECRWVGFFDVDEFYYFPSPKNRNGFSDNPGPGSLRDVVQNVTDSAPEVGEIRTDCHSFGPSGLKKSPEEGVTLGYTCRMRSPERHKSIVRPDAVDDTLLNQVHHFKLKKEFRKTTLLQSTALINHYKYQVWDTFKSKFYRRVSTFVVDWQENQNENSRDRAPGLGTEAIEPPDWHKRFCEVWDTRLRDFILANLGDPDTGLAPWGSSDQ